MNILFVLNPKSGKEENDKVEDIISRQFTKQGITWELIRTRGTGDKKRIGNMIKKHNPEKVVAIGGDGTINLVASQLLDKNIKLGIIPTGSANGLAYNLNIPSEIEKALLHVMNAKARPIDVLVINDRYHCLHLADAGINARLVKRFEKEGSKGMAGYGRQLVKEIFSKKKAFVFQFDSSEIQKKMKAEMLVIANAKEFGTGAQINPKGVIDDGKFEIIVIRPYPWWYFITFLFSAFTGKLHRIKHVKVYSTNQAQIDFKNPMDVQVDGEMLEEISQLRITIMTGALKVLYI